MHAMGDIISPEINSWKRNSRRPLIYLKEFVQEGVKNVPLQKRCTQRKLALSMGVSKTTVDHWIVASTIHIHCNSLKPVLTEENKVARLLMALHFRDPLDPMKYHDMHWSCCDYHMVAIKNCHTFCYDTISVNRGKASCTIHCLFFHIRPRNS